MLSLADILGDLSTLHIDEKRRLEPAYAELVVNAAGWQACYERLCAVLGQPVKSLDAKPTSAQEKRADPWGGVRKGQILFDGKADGRPVVALIWPWEGGGRYTVKLAAVKE